MPRGLLAVFFGVPVCLLLRPPAPDLALTDAGPPAAPAVQITPKGTLVSATAHATGYVATFLVKNVGTVNSTYTLACNTSGQLSCVSVAPTQVTLSPNQQVDADVTYATGDMSPPSGNFLRLAATGGGVDTGHYTVTVNGSMVELAATGALTSAPHLLDRRMPRCPDHALRTRRSFVPSCLDWGPVAWGDPGRGDDGGRI